jgi:tetratricopeptide (TPR) repeat protein
MCANWVHGPALAETDPGLPPLQAAPGAGRHVSSASGAVPGEMLRRIRASTVQRAAPAGEEGLTPSDLRHDRFVALSRAAEAEEAEGKWEEAIEHWRQALKYAENKELVTARLEGLKRELAFEQVLSSATTLATAGDWARAEAALASAASMRLGDRPVEQARARLPRRLIEAWLDSARARLSHFSDPSARQAVLRKLAAARARAGDFAGAVRWIQEETLEVEGRVRLLAHAACAAIQVGAREGLRPYLDRALATAANLEEPGARGRACLEMGRALAAYGDPEAAAGALQTALSTFLAVGRDYEHLASPTGEPLSSNVTTRWRLVTSTRRYARVPQAAKEGGWENTLSALAEVQAEAGLTEAAVATTALIEDPWSRAQALASVVQVLARIGRPNEADHAAGTITFRLPRARALRAVAISRIYRGDLNSAEGIMRELASPEERAPVEAYLAAARYKRGEKQAAETHAREALQTAAEAPGPAAHLHVLLAALEPLLDVGAAELAKPFLEAAGRIVDGTEEPAERLAGLLVLGRLRARAAPPLLDSSTGAPREVYESLRRALASLRLVAGQAEREECTERLATAIAEAGAAELAAELLSLCQTESERAMAYSGLAAGLV